MATFRIKEVEEVKMAYIYHVEAETKEEALDKYINQLAGSLEIQDSFVSNAKEESITVID